MHLPPQLAPDEQTCHESRTQGRHERLARIAADIFLTVPKERAGALPRFIVSHPGLSLHLIGRRRTFRLHLLHRGTYLRAYVSSQIRRFRFQLIEQRVQLFRGERQLFAQPGQQLLAFAFDESQIVIGELRIALLELPFDGVPLVFKCEMCHAIYIVPPEASGRVETHREYPPTISRPDTRTRRLPGDACDAMKNDANVKSPRSVDDLLQRADEFARREPTRATVSAFGAGLLLNFLPLSAIAATLVGVAFALVRPALLFLGLFKACELCRSQPQTESNHE